MPKLMKVWQLGTISYAKALKLQKYLSNLHHQKSDEIVDTLLCLEHHPVYTTGIRTKGYTEEEENRLKRLGAEFYRTDRGGLITFHGPGQLVVYPIINLQKFNAGMRWYVCQIENTIIDLCKKYEIKAETSPNTGVWVGNNKICAIGIHGSRFITTHGLALNCCIDLKWFDHIIPCGIEGKGVTSISKELNKKITTEEVVPLFLDSFSKIFNCNYINYPKDEAETILSNL